MENKNDGSEQENNSKNYIIQICKSEKMYNRGDPNFCNAAFMGIDKAGRRYCPECVKKHKKRK